MVLQAELWDLGRFSDKNALCSYVGLAPRLVGSVEHETICSAESRKKKELHYILIEAEWQSMLLDLIKLKQEQYKMRAVAIADEDFQIGNIRINSIDVLLSLGDLWVPTIEKACSIYHPQKTFAVRGNHDSNTPFPDFVTPLHCTIETFRGMTFAGFDGCWRYKARGQYLYSQNEVRQLLLNFPRVDVFIAHNSPRGFHERDYDIHQGFDGFVEYIRRAQPAYFIHGHQHLAATTQIGKTMLIGVFGEMLIELNQ